MELTQSPDQPVSQASSHPPFFVAGVWMLVLATCMLSCGLLSAMSYLVAPFLVKNRDRAIQTNILLGSFAALGLAFGVLWAWQGALALRGRATTSPARVFPRVMVWVAAFLLVIALGMSALAVKPIAAFVFPPFHFLAAAIPPLAFLAYVARRLNVTSGLRALIVSLGWGTFGGTFLALSLEILIGVIIVVIAGVALSLAPEGAGLLERLRVELESLRALNDQAIVQRLLAHPGIVAAAAAYFVAIVPLIEETFKTLIVAFADPRRTTARDALLWGIAAGAGFAIIENTLNTGAALDVWALAMLIRIGATVMHVTNGATMARGWYAARVERRWSRLFIAYGVSIFLHAVWNALAIGQGIGFVFLANGEQWTFDMSSPLFWLGLAFLLGLIVLTFGGAGWIAYSVQTVREASLQQIQREGDAQA